MFSDFLSGSEVVVVLGGVVAAAGGAAVSLRPPTGQRLLKTASAFFSLFIITGAVRRGQVVPGVLDDAVVAIAVAALAVESVAAFRKHSAFFASRASTEVCDTFYVN